MGWGLRAEGWRSSGGWGYGAWRLGPWELRRVAGEGASKCSSYLQKVSESVGPDPNPVRAVNTCVTWVSESAWPFLVDKHKEHAPSMSSPRVTCSLARALVS